MLIRLVIVVIFTSGCLCGVLPDEVTLQSESREGTTDINRTSVQESRIANSESTEGLPEERKANEEKRSANNDTTETIAETRTENSKNGESSATTIETKTGAVDEISTEIINSDSRSDSTEKLEESQLSRSDENDTSRTQQSDEPNDDDSQSRSGNIETDTATTDTSHIKIKEGRRAPREKNEEAADESSQTRKSEENPSSSDELRTSYDGESKSADDATERKASPEKETIDTNQDDLRTAKLFDDSTDDLRTEKIFDDSTDDLQTRRMNPNPNDNKHGEVGASEVRMAPREGEHKKPEPPVAYRKTLATYLQKALIKSKNQYQHRQQKTRVNIGNGVNEAAESRKEACIIEFDTRPSQHLKSDYNFAALEDLTLPLLKTAQVSSTENRLISNLEPPRSSSFNSARNSLEKVSFNSRSSLNSAHNSQEKETFNSRSSFHPAPNSLENNANLQFPFPSLGSEAFKPSFQKHQAPLKVFLDEPQAPFKPFFQEFRFQHPQQSSAENRKFSKEPKPLFKPFLEQAPFRVSLPESNAPLRLSYSEESQASFKPLNFQKSQAQFKQFFQDSQAQFRQSFHDAQAPFQLSSLSMLDRPLKMPPLPLNQRPFQHQEPWDPNCSLCNNPSHQNWQSQPQYQRLQRSLLPQSIPDSEPLGILLWP